MQISQQVFDAVHDSTTRITRRAEIYEEDGQTLWLTDVPLLDGSVSVDSTRSERRTASLTFSNDTGALSSNPRRFWYDKVIKVYRGITWEVAGEPEYRNLLNIFESTFESDFGGGVERTQLVDYEQFSWEIQIGEFLIDSISEDDFPNTVTVECRDYAKKLILAQFPVATTFASGSAVEEVIRNIAVNGGITKFIFPTSTGKRTGQEYLFEGGTERWSAMNDLAVAHGFDLYFDAQGYLVLSPIQDPVYSPTLITFRGGSRGNLSGFKKVTHDSQIRNHVVVVGETSSQIPVFAEAKNLNPASPTSINNLRQTRTYRYSSALVTTAQQAREVANNFLKVMALESYEVNIESLVIPWLEAGRIVELLLPEARPDEPKRYLLSSFEIPLTPGPMSSNVKRVTVVG